MKETKIIKKVSKKNGTVKYEYYVDGVKVRTSGRIYVASTVNGEIFFGRVDLIGKGQYAKEMEKCIDSEKQTLESVQKYAEGRLAEAEKEYRRQHSEKKLNWLRNLYSWRADAEEEAQEQWAKDKAWAERHLSNARQDATPEGIQKTLHNHWAWAERRRKALEIVRYDINNIIEK